MTTKQLREANATAAHAVFDYRVMDVADQRFVKEREVWIRRTARQTAQGIIDIGQWLVEAKERMPHGMWLPWLNASFGWTLRTAQRFMAVAEAFKCDTVSYLEIDVSSLYLLAAPSTPEPVIQEVIKRAKSGERITKAKAIEVLEDYSARATVPPPDLGRQIAIATGTSVATSDGTFAFPMTEEEQEDLGNEQTMIRNLYQALGDVANTAVTPEQMVRLGKKHFCVDLIQFSEAAAVWIAAVIKEAKQ